MRKILFTMLITFLVLILGQTLYYNSKDRRDIDFLNNDVYVNLKEGNINEFIDSSLLVLKADSYYKDPLYKFTSNEINIEIYIVNVEKEKALVTFFYGIKEISDLSQVNILFTTNASNITVSAKRSVFNVDNEFVGGGFFIPIYLNEDNFHYLENNNEVRFSEIKTIDMSYLYKTEDKSDKQFLEIKVNDSFKLNVTNEDILEKNDDILISNKFSGNVKDYNNLNLEGSELVIPNKDKFKPFNKVIVTTLVTYGLVMVVVSLYAIFRKQIHALFTKKKIS